jgi:hypothetical protein
VFKELLKRVADGLSRNSIPYMVIGGQAVLLYGEPRLTKDIDVTLGVGVEGLPAVLEVTEDLGLKCLPPDVERFVRQTMVLPVVDQPSGIRVDFIFSFSPYERQAIERAREVELDDGRIRFASLEDVVIHKVIAGRPRDLEDIKAILLKNPGYDGEYIRRWLAEFDSALAEGFLSRFATLLRELT